MKRLSENQRALLLDIWRVLWKPTAFATACCLGLHFGAGWGWGNSALVADDIYLVCLIIAMSSLRGARYAADMDLFRQAEKLCEQARVNFDKAEELRRPPHSRPYFATFTVGADSAEDVAAALLAVGSHIMEGSMGPGDYAGKAGQGAEPTAVSMGAEWRMSFGAPEKAGAVIH